MRRLSILLTFIFFFAGLHFTYARGGTSSISGRAVGTIITLVYVFVLLIIIRVKNNKAKRQIDSFHTSDPLWDYNMMISITDEIFNKIQIAWSQRNMDLVKGRITNTLYEDYKKKLDWMIVKHEKNIIKDIEIKKIKIVGDEEFISKEKDKFTAYVYGKFINYSISDKTERVTENSEMKKTTFRDLYYFIREDDKWILDKIDNGISLFKILKAKQIGQ